MIDSAHAYSLEKAGDWDALFELVSSWPSVQAKDWYLGNYYLLYKCDYLFAAEAYGRMLSTTWQLPAQAYLRLGKALHGCDRVEEALQYYLKVLLSSQAFDDSWRRDALVAYGLACLELGLYEHWLSVLEKFSQWNIASPHLNYLSAQANFFLGRWELGWKLYEDRKYWFKCELSDYRLCVWNLGDPRPKGETIWVGSDLGMGDFIFFLRFVPQLRQYYRFVCALVPSNLYQLAVESGFFDRVYSFYDSLPWGLNCVLKLSSICSFIGSSCSCHDASLSVPYLSITKPSWLAMQSLELSNRDKPLVAMNWSGNQEAESPSLTVRARSVPVSVLETIHAFHAVDLLSVQYGRRNELRFSSLNQFIHPLQNEFEQLNDDLCVTAFMLMQCDLLITNDTSVAHLGGALGIPTWVMLKCYPSWQWGSSGESLFYQSVRCFRQFRPFDWFGVAAEVDHALQSWVKSWHSDCD